MKRAVGALLVLAAGLAGTPESAAQMRRHSWEVSPHVGILNGSDRFGDGVEPLAGLRVGYHVNRWWQFELAYGVMSDAPVQQPVGQRLRPGLNAFGQGVWDLIEVDRPADSDITQIDLNAVLTATPKARRWVPYATIGVGLADFSGALTQQQVDAAFPQGTNPVVDAFDFDNDGNTLDMVNQFICPTCTIDAMTDPNNPTFLATGREIESFDSSQWNIGGGVRLLLTDAMALRFDLRIVTGATKTYNNQILTAGLSFRLGGEAPIDDDGDTIPSFRDHCPETLTGATVDPRGCPSDSDGDEILDGLDACPETPEGWPIDGTGCPLDTDGDAVPDGRDTCPDTLEGAVVDGDGCAVDSDGDGMPDGLDECAATPAGAAIDDVGCPLDSDEDGIFDGLDQCSGTPAGLIVDALGCPIDSDGDGLKDDVDACPDFNGVAGVDEEGCPRLRLDKQTRLRLPGITFASGSSTLTDTAQADLLALVEAMTHFDNLTIEIEGHTDSVGSERDNFLISLERARAVQSFLENQGISGDRLATRGYGEIRPAGDNETPEGRRTNRRIEVLVTGTVDAEEAAGDD